MKKPQGLTSPPLAEALRACKRHFVFAMVFSAMVNILYLAPTIYMMQVYDRVVGTGGLTTLAFVTLAVAFALSVLSILDGIRAAVLARAGMRLDRLLAGELLGRLLSRLHGGRQSARINQAMREFDTFRTTLTGPATLALFDVPWTPIYILVAFLLSPWLGLLTIAGAAGLLGLAVLNERATKAKLQKAAEAQAIAYASQEAASAQADVVRALGMRRALVSRHLKERSAAAALQLEAQMGGKGYSGATRFLRLLLQSLALGAGAWLAVEHQISSGSIIAASVLLSRALQPIEQVVGAWGPLVRARSAYATVNELLDEKLADMERTDLPEPKGAVQVEQASVRAPGGEGAILKGVSLAMRPGEIVGVVGASGSGKTTLARLVAGATNPDAGVVRYDGADLTDWDSDKVGRHVGYLPQNSALFAGTIRDNISRFAGALGEDKATVDARTVEAAQAAGVHEMILRLPDAYETRLGLGGQGLSAGQAQRVALARALYGQPKVLVMDEPNSNLDAEGEMALMRALVAVKGRGAAVLVVAHRATILQVVDTLVVMNGGAIEVAGPREEVLKRLGQGDPAGGAPPRRQEPLRAAEGPR